MQRIAVCLFLALACAHAPARPLEAFPPKRPERADGRRELLAGRLALALPRDGEQVRVPRFSPWSWDGYAVRRGGDVFTVVAAEAYQIVSNEAPAKLQPAEPGLRYFEAPGIRDADVAGGFAHPVLKLSAAQPDGTLQHLWFFANDAAEADGCASLAARFGSMPRLGCSALAESVAATAVPAGRVLERARGPVRLPDKLRVDVPADRAVEIVPGEDAFAAKFLRVSASRAPVATLSVFDGPRPDQRVDAPDRSLDLALSEDWFLGHRVLWTRGLKDGKHVTFASLDVGPGRFITFVATADDENDVAALEAIARGISVEK